MPAHCQLCQGAIPMSRQRRHALFCSDTCTTKSYRLRHPVASYAGVPRSSVGAIHELVVATDLMERGYAVFRALSPHSPCDLMVWQANAHPCRIEVTTGRVGADGVVAFPKGVADVAKSDVMAVVIPETERTVVYFPTMCLLTRAKEQQLVLEDAIDPRDILGPPGTWAPCGSAAAICLG